MRHHHDLVSGRSVELVGDVVENGCCSFDAGIDVVDHFDLVLGKADGCHQGQEDGTQQAFHGRLLCIGSISSPKISLVTYISNRQLLCKASNST
ncbi:hypothetical protein D3C71_1824850 [compost metagenome]